LRISLAGTARFLDFKEFVMAKRKIVISEYDNIAALMEDDRAVEFIIHRGDMLLGDVYLATVENILPSIDAAFLNVGGDKMGFLHSSDVPGKGDLKDRLEPKQQLVVQIMKEPTGHKGPRVSTNISLPGRFLVMMPESKGISISRKIMESAERARLKSVVSLIKPPGVGVIIRTEALNQKESDITEDFETLLERWQNIVSMADTASAPTLLYRDQDLLYRVIREAVTEDVTEIVVDSAFGQQRAQQLLQNWNMDKGVKVTHFQGSQPILVGTGVDKEIKLALQTKVPLPSGGYLYIQPTEALSVVDVNSGKFTSLQSQAETIKLTNLEACKEIARQLRLRNIGGMIIVDFIDMESRANQLQVLQTFEKELAPDKAKPQMGQLSDLGLVEMTRHRQGQSLSEIFTRRCQTCSGTGHALEEFSWINTGGDSDGRGRPGGRHSNHQPGGGNANSKLPMRQANRLQQLPKPAASVHQRREKGRIPLGGNLGDSAKREAQSQVANTSNILTAELTKQNKGQVAQRPQNSSNPNISDSAEGLTETLIDRLSKKLGIHLAAAAKFSYIPPAINSVLSRIHPKANDIVSLVHSIEETAQQPSFNPRYEEEEEERSDEPGDEDFDEETNSNNPEALTDSPQAMPQPNSHRSETLHQQPALNEAEKSESLLDEEVVLTEEEANLAEVRQPNERPRRPRGPRRSPSIDSSKATETEGENSTTIDEDNTESPEALPAPPLQMEAEEHSEYLLRSSSHTSESKIPGEADDAVDDEQDDYNGNADDDDDSAANVTTNTSNISSTAQAIAAAAAAKRRRGGRTAKRSIKKPPAKR
jgi:Rne/Rng family ribonuclease